MAIRTQCGQCATSFDAPEKLAGKKVRCPKCGTVISILAPEPDHGDPLADLFDDDLLADTAFDGGPDPLGASAGLLSDPLATTGAAPLRTVQGSAAGGTNLGTLLKRYKVAAAVAAIAAGVLILALVVATILPGGSDSVGPTAAQTKSAPPPAVPHEAVGATDEPERMALSSDPHAVSWSVVPDPAPPAKPINPRPIWLRGESRSTPHVRFAGRISGRMVVCSVVSEEFPRGLNSPVEKVLTSYDLAGGGEERRVQLPEGNVQMLDVSPDGDLVLVAPKDFRRSNYSRLDVWSFESGAKLVEWKPFDANDRHRVEWGVFVDQQHVLTRGTTRELTLWKIPECRPVHTIEHVSRVVALSPTRKYIAVRHRDAVNGTMRFYDVFSGNARGDLEGGFRGVIHSAAVRSDGRALAVVGDKEIFTWDLTTGNRSGEASIVIETPGRYRGVDWLTDRYLLVNGRHVYDLERGDLVWQYSYSASCWPVGCRDGRFWVSKPGAVLSDSLYIDEVVRQAAKRSRKPEENAIASPGTEVQIAVDIRGNERSKVEHSLRTKLERDGFVVVDSAPVEVTVAAQERSTGQRVETWGGVLRSKDLQFDEKEINATLTFHKGPDTWKQTWKVPLPRQVRIEADARPAPAFYEQMWRNFRTSLHRRKIPRWVFPSSDGNTGGVDSAASGIGETRLALGATRPGDRGSLSLPESRFGKSIQREKDEVSESVKRGRERIRAAHRYGSKFRTHDISPREINEDEQSRRRYLEKNYVDLIAGDGDAIERRLRWFSAAKRPAIGLRWGLGIEMADQTEQPTIADVGDLQQYTGPIGGELVAELNERTADGLFGAWPKNGDRRLHEVALAGGKYSDLLAVARKRALDAMVVIELSTKHSGFRGRQDTAMKIHVVDVRGKLRRWTSPTVTSNALAAAQRSGQDPAAELVAKVTKYIDEQYSLASMPKISASAARRRASSLTARKSASPLEVLTELRYYHAKKLLTDEQVAKHYDALLGSGQGKALLEGSSDQRQKLLDNWSKNQK